jgi:hypothetical protein
MTCGNVHWPWNMNLVSACKNLLKKIFTSVEIYWFMFEILRKRIFIGHHVKPKRTLLLVDFNKNWKVLINCSKNFPAWYFTKYISAARFVTCRRIDRHTDRSKKRAQFCTFSLPTLQAALTPTDVRNLNVDLVIEMNLLL